MSFYVVTAIPFQFGKVLLYVCVYTYGVSLCRFACMFYTFLQVLYVLFFAEVSTVLQFYGSSHVYGKFLLLILKLSLWYTSLKLYYDSSFGQLLLQRQQMLISFSRFQDLAFL